MDTIRAKKVFKNYLAELDGDFDSGTASHHLTYERCTANKKLHTQGNRQQDEHWMNLASLEVDKEEAEADTFFSFWVKAADVGLRFIAEQLFSDQETQHIGSKRAPAPAEKKQSTKKKSRTKAAANEPEPEPVPEPPAAVGPKLSKSQKRKAELMKEAAGLF